MSGMLKCWLEWPVGMKSREIRDHTDYEGPRELGQNKNSAGSCQRSSRRGETRSDLCFNRTLLLEWGYRGLERDKTSPGLPHQTPKSSRLVQRLSRAGGSWKEQSAARVGQQRRPWAAGQSLPWVWVAESWARP